MRLILIAAEAEKTSLTTTRYPVLSATDARTSKILLIVVAALHAGLAIAIKVLFFAHGSPLRKDAPNGDDKPTDEVLRMLFA